MNCFSRCWSTLLLVILSLRLLAAQTDTTKDSIYNNGEKIVNENLDLSTPAATISTHLANLQPENYHPEIAALTIFPDEGLNLKTRIRLVRQLKQILDAKNLFIVTGPESKKPDYKRTVQGEGKVSKYILHEDLPEVYLEKFSDGNWYYSQETVSKIPGWYDDAFPMGLGTLITLLPPTSSTTFFGLALWQYIGLLGLVLLAFVFHKVLTYFIGTVFMRVLKRFKKAAIARAVVKPISTPLSLFVVFYLLTVLIPVLQLPITFSKYLMLFLHIAQPIYVIMMLYRLVDFFGEYMESLAEKTEGTLDDQLVPLLRKALRVFVVIIGIVWVLQVMNFDITTLLAGISIGGLAFALAAQDTIKNLFGSFTIFVDKPFQMGDWINGSGFDGTVEEVGFRTTRIRTFYNSVISIPNGKLADMAIDNYGMRVYRRYMTYIGVQYDTPPDLIRAFVEGLKKIVENHPATRKEGNHIYVNQFSASSIDILFYIFFKVPDWGKELEGREDIILSIIELAEELGVQFAFPTQTLHVENLPGQPSLSAKYETDLTRLNEKIVHYMKSRYLASKGTNGSSKIKVN